MNEWEECCLTDIAYINPTERLSKGTIAKKIGMDALLPFTKFASGYISEEYKGGTKFRNKDTLVARITPCLENGKTCYVNLLENGEVGFGSTEYIVLRNKDNKSDDEFLYYFSRADVFREVAIASMTGSSGRQRVQTDAVVNHLFLFPTLSEQKAIASVLSSLDNKIDLLHRQNKTLEAMAETLFRQWFGGDTQENEFGIKRLDDVAFIQNGYAFSSKDYISSTGSELEVLKMGHIGKDGGLKLNPKKNFVPRATKLEKWILSKNDIVMAMTDMKDNVVILGVPALIDADNKYVLNQRVARITLKNNNDFIHPILLYLQLKDKDFILNLQNQANSGVQVNLSTQTIKDAEIYIPDMNKQKAFGKNIINLYQRVELIRNQIKLLEVLRDTLLPKLMSGEVRVTY